MLGNKISQYSVIEKDGLRYTDFNRTLADALANENILDMQGITEALSHYYYSNGNSYNGIALVPEYQQEFEHLASSAIDYYNNGGSTFSGGNGGSSGGLGRQFSIEDVDFVERTILSCSRSCSEDASISIILIEEMPAYFLGQKDLDAVIKIAQNRIQKVLDERG